MKLLSWLKTPVVFYGGQALIILVVTIYFSFYNPLLELKWAILIYLVILFNVFFDLMTLKIIKLNHQQEKIIKKKDEKLKALNDFNNRIRAERHDYLNHLQTVYGLLQIGQIEEANDYMAEVASDVCLTSQMLRLKKPAVNALLQRKIVQARSQDIAFNLAIQTDLAHLAIHSYDLNRILGNLIDNALEAVVPLPPGQRQVRLEIYDNESWYCIKVINTGLEIDQKVRQSMFEPGFSTKSTGWGLGLFIVKNTIDLNKGKLAVSFSPVTFKVKLPKQRQVTDCGGGGVNNLNFQTGKQAVKIP